MKKPFIFGHRGAMGYEIENTLPSFDKAVELNVGIETDVQLTKDNYLICFHDPYFQIMDNWHVIKDMTLEEIREIKFNDNRIIPTLDDVFKKYKLNSPRYSIDIANRNTGYRVIDLAKKYDILDKIEITDLRMRVLAQLRKYNQEVKLVHTLPFNIRKISKRNLNFKELIENNIHAINLKNERTRDKDNFKIIVENGLKCYVWGVNSKFRMKRVLKLNYRNEIVDAIYTDYPDILLNFIDQYY
jgi:glycerophosphoryl diester phosphodiesterase